MQTILDKIKSALVKPMEEMNITIDSIEYVCESNNYFLKIVLDKVNGIDLDTIVEATNVINPILDELDLIKDEYILDISSKERG